MDWKDRIKIDAKVMTGKPCIAGTRVTVGTLMGMMAGGVPRDRILGAYPYVQAEDLDAVMHYAAWLMEESAGARVPA